MKTVAGVLICLLAAGCTLPNGAKDQLSAGAREQTNQPHYQLAGDGDGNACRLDTISGQMDKCWQGTGGLYNATCAIATEIPARSAQ